MLLATHFVAPHFFLGVLTLVKIFEGVGAVGDTFCGTSFFGFLEYLTLIKILKVWVLLATHFVALGEGGGWEVLLE